ncbi:hypothetical protein ACE1TI_17965 [Alteribacillus sp. JSM 102045]|uniref:hypothetical protein n=1 Tax=Alteribacillus sp. JSM 102045 TaxID=1562101 RepID=UPI0035C029E6
MKTCVYCGSKVDHLYCTFCDMELREDLLSDEGKRKDVTFHDFAFLDWMNKSTPELMRMHTMELLLLLREVRKARSNNFGTLHVFNKLREQNSADIEKLTSYQGTEYEYVTRKTWVIENIIRDRLGYIPERMSQSFLIQQIEKSKKKPKTMKMRKTPRNSDSLNEIS